MTNKRIKPTFKKNYYEELSWQNNRAVCGIDEVGRGCLAGPLVTGAVIIPPHKHHRLLKDSKLLTENEREIAYAWILRHCYTGIGILHNRFIDKHNIWQTTLIAMKKALVHALAQSPMLPEAILVDAMPLQVHDTGYADIPVFNFIKGESKSTSIAAASILAKVTRDRLMKAMDPLFPGYGIVSHKGYSTKVHQHALFSQGACLLHRTSFIDTMLARHFDETEQQQTLF